MKKALLIGIDYLNKPDLKLNGCINDIVNMRNMLIDAYDYSYSNITMLRDDSTLGEFQPTKTNIIRQLITLASQSISLEEIWIHYSGHGSQIQNLSKEADEQEDELLVPINYDKEGFIKDDELLSIIKTIKCRCVLLFDSCNSGTVCDLPYTINYQSPARFTVSTINKSLISNPNIFMFSSCRDNQTSADVFNTASYRYGGAFTLAFLECLRNSKHNTSFMLLYRDICIYLANKGLTQIPVLSSSSTSPTGRLLRALPQALSVAPVIKQTASSAIKNTMKSFLLPMSN